MPSYRNTPAHALRSNQNGDDSIFADALQEIQTKAAAKTAAAKTAALSKQAKATIARFNLWRVAGNMYECPSSRDFWQVTADGGIKRLTKSTSVDHGESLPAADATNPEDTLNTILADLTL
jgi:hypothetical protein